MMGQHGIPLAFQVGAPTVDALSLRLQLLYQDVHASQWKIQRRWHVPEDSNVLPIQLKADQTPQQHVCLVYTVNTAQSVASCQLLVESPSRGWTMLTNTCASTCSSSFSYRHLYLVPSRDAYFKPCLSNHSNHKSHPMTAFIIHEQRI